MRIGIFIGTNGSGITRYAAHLVRNLLKIDREDKYYLYSDGSPIFSIPRSRGRLVYKRLPIDYAKQELAFRFLQVGFPRQLGRDRIDVLHTEFFAFPVNAPCPVVVTLHDLIPFLGPVKAVSRAWQRIASKHFLLAARLADRIIVPSRSVKKELVEAVKIRSEKVTQIYWGLPSFFRPIPRRVAFQWVRRRFRVTRPYLLGVGMSRRKNPSLLIQAFRRNRLQRDYDLVFVGRLLRHEPKVLRWIRMDPSIHYLGVVSDRELVHLYQAAECLVFPSQAEGFGFPPLEAMACGTPAIASRCGSLTEVMGNAGLFVEPGSVDGLADALERFLGNISLQQALRQRGLKWVRRFQWNVAAARHHALYRSFMDVPANGSGTRPGVR